jgi:hypothetical protein
MEQDKSKTLKIASEEAFKILIWFVVIFSVVAVIWTYTTGELFNPFLINAVIWLVADACLYAVAKSRRKKLDKYKENGIRYPMEITKFAANAHVRVGGYVSAQVEGYYLNGLGQKRQIRSKDFLLQPFELKENLIASVYVSRENPYHYEVDVQYK